MARCVLCGDVRKHRRERNGLWLEESRKGPQKCGNDSATLQQMTLPAGEMEERQIGRANCCLGMS